MRFKQYITESLACDKSKIQIANKYVIDLTRALEKLKGRELKTSRYTLKGIEYNMFKLPGKLVNDELSNATIFLVDTTYMNAGFDFEHKFTKGLAFVFPLITNRKIDPNALTTLKPTFVHEFIHYIDFMENKIFSRPSITAAINHMHNAIEKGEQGGALLYMLSDHEFNAYFLQEQYVIEEYLKADPSHIKILDSWKKFTYSIFDIMDYSGEELKLGILFTMDEIYNAMNNKEYDKTEVQKRYLKFRKKYLKRLKRLYDGLKEEYRK